MARPLTPTAHALLGLLALRPWSTYELAKQVQRSLGWFWPRAERRLYDEPKRLVEAGLATATASHTGRRPRTVYSITARGRRALAAWLEEPPAPPALESEAMVKVFLADGGSREALDRTLAEVQEQAEARLAELRSMIEDSRSGAYEFKQRLHLNALGLRFQLDHQEQIARWAAWAREQVATWPSTTDPGEWDWEAALR
jgi:DNA-binding PadR family transcriptional regulator